MVVGRRVRHRVPGLAWMVVALLYLTAAVLNVLLTLSMGVWWPLALSAGFGVVAGGCLLLAVIERRRGER